MQPQISIERRLGEGDEKVAYQGRYTQGPIIKKPVVLVRKHLQRRARSPTAASNAARAQSVDEAALNAQLQHPNIGLPFAHVTHEEEELLAYEGVNGQSLEDALADPAVTLDIMQLRDQLLDAVAATHASGRLHRDIKPANTIVFGEKHLKLIDFGSSQQGQPVQEPFFVRATTAYTHPQTLNTWLSGEPSSYTQADDLFATVATVFELMTGRKATNYAVVENTDGVLVPGTASRAQLLVSGVATKRIDEQEYTAHMQAAARQLPRAYRKLFTTGLSYSQDKGFNTIPDFKQALTSADKAAIWRPRLERSGLLAAGAAAMVAVFAGVATLDSKRYDTPALRIGETLEQLDAATGPACRTRQHRI